MIIWSYEGHETRYRSKPIRFESHVMQFAEELGILPGTAIVFHNTPPRGIKLTQLPGNPLSDIDLSTSQGLEEAKQRMRLEELTKPSKPRLNKPRTTKSKKNELGKTN